VEKTKRNWQNNLSASLLFGGHGTLQWYNSWIESVKRKANGQNHIEVSRMKVHAKQREHASQVLIQKIKIFKKAQQQKLVPNWQPGKNGGGFFVCDRSIASAEP